MPRELLEESLKKDAEAAATRRSAADKARKAAERRACPPSEHDLCRLALGDASREQDADALILRVELFARIAEQALRLDVTDEVHRNVANAIALLPPPPRPAATKDDIKAHDESESRCVKADASSETPFRRGQHAE